MCGSCAVLVLSGSGLRSLGAYQVAARFLLLLNKNEHLQLLMTVIMSLFKMLQCRLRQLRWSHAAACCGLLLWQHASRLLQ